VKTGLCKLILNYWKSRKPPTITKQPLPSTKRFSIRIKTIKSAVSYYLNKGDKIYTDEIKKVGFALF
jgi:hypothetical protein